MTTSQHVYEIRPRKDHRGADLISDALPFGRLWYGEPNAISSAIDYAKFRSRSHNAVIRVSRWSGHRDRDARAQGRFQRTMNAFLGLLRRSLLTDYSGYGATNRLQDAI
jgi:hypothetical protein